MPGTKKQKVEKVKTDKAVSSPARLWLRADYVAHVFHYRMPETVAIAAVNPFVPSPLTVKMALVAVFLREGRREEAEGVVNAMLHVEVRIKPPDGGIGFRAFLRYTRVPEAGKRTLTETGGIYGISPHTREYVIWSGHLSIYLLIPEKPSALFKEALWKIPYLGAKDSLVSCINVSEEKPDESECVIELKTEMLEIAKRGFIVRLAELKGSPDLMELIPTQRKEEHYRHGFFLVPGTLRASGKTKIFHRE